MIEYARRIGARLPTDEELKTAFAGRAVERIRPATWEWTSTADGSYRAYRGGGWDFVIADSLSASNRGHIRPKYRGDFIGLRCARPIEPGRGNTVMCTDLGIEVDMLPVTIGRYRSVMGSTPPGNEDRPAYQPVVFVTASEADEYCARLGGRLPTDEELRVLQTEERIISILPVSWEWTGCMHDGVRSVRGGGWDIRPSFARASDRYRGVPGNQVVPLGFRCVWEIG